MKIKAQHLKKDHVLYSGNSYRILDKEPIVTSDLVCIESFITFKKDEVVDVLSVRCSQIRTFDKEDSILQLSKFSQAIRSTLASSVEFMADIERGFSHGIDHLCPSLAFASYGSLIWCSRQKRLYASKKARGRVVSMQKEQCPLIIHEGGPFLFGDVLLMRDGVFLITASVEDVISLVRIPEHD